MGNIYGQIARSTFQSPQWGDNSKEVAAMTYICNKDKFQSPQWGDNSKGRCFATSCVQLKRFQSPQWGDNSKDRWRLILVPLPKCFSPHNGEIILKAMGLGLSFRKVKRFQSPQWGDNSKDEISKFTSSLTLVSVPAMGR